MTTTTSSRSIPRWFPLLSLAAVLLLVACQEAAGPGWTFATLGPTTSPAATEGESPAPGETPAGSPGASPGVSPGASPNGAPGGNVFELEMTGDLRILQDGQPATEIRVQEGQEYTFRVTNSAGFTHNFYLGPPDRLMANDVGDLPGIPDYESGTEEFSWTATSEAEGWEFACTVPGHYQNMHGSLVIEQ